jgi:hypothetical protein
VQVTEVRADDVPVRLLALQGEVAQVDQQLLEVAGELLVGLEGGVRDVLVLTVTGRGGRHGGCSFARGRDSIRWDRDALTQPAFLE